MSLKVIGAGFGRTGTHSLKIALEMLGFAPCYHMVEVFSHPGQAEMWEAAARGEAFHDLLGPPINHDAFPVPTHFRGKEPAAARIQFLAIDD